MMHFKYLAYICLLMLLIASCFSTKTTFVEPFEVHLKPGDEVLVVDDRLDEADIYLKFNEQLNAHNVTVREYSFGSLEYEHLYCRNTLSHIDTVCLSQVSEKTGAKYLILNRKGHLKRRSSEAVSTSEQNYGWGTGSYLDTEKVTSHGTVHFEVWDLQVGQRVALFDTKNTSKGIGFGGEDDTTVNVVDPEITLIKARKKGIRTLRKMLVFHE